jgi:hypothetical protein
MIALAMMWVLLAVPLLSLLFLNGSELRRFLPAALFITVLNTVIAQLGDYYRWWTIRSTLFAWSEGRIDAPVVYGLFLAGTVWVMKLTYGRFFLFILLSAAMDGAFAYLFAPLVEWAGWVQLGIIPKQGLFFLMFGSALVLYLFQVWFEREDAEFEIGQGMQRARY